MEGGACEGAADGPPVSVVVPVLNEEKVVRQLVRHLQSLRPAPAEILIIDGGSSDGTGRPASVGEPNPPKQTSDGLTDAARTAQSEWRGPRGACGSCGRSAAGRNR